MQGMKAMTKQDLLDFVNEKFKDKRPTDDVATFFYCSAGAYELQQQCILFREEVKNK